MKGIVIVGLGPGDAGLLTRRAWEHLVNIAEIYLRTQEHPTVEDFPAGLLVHSFDDLYDQGDTFEEVYEKIVQEVLRLGARPEGVTYAVPGHPYVAEATTPEIVRQARGLGLPVQVIDGVSFLEPVFSALGLDPYPSLTLVDAITLGTRHMPGFPPDEPALVAQIYSRAVAAELKLTLNAVYPDTHPVRLVHGAGTAGQVVEDLALYEIDRSPHIGLLTALYVPPLDQDTSLEGFQEIVAHLRAPDGCPWDKEQTIQSLGPMLLEETYEALETIDQDDMLGLCEEIGDLLLIVTLLSQIGSEEGLFSMAEIIQGIHRKIVRRHPHVFGDVDIDSAAGVLRNWEKLKENERREQNHPEVKGILDGVAKILPALTRAQEYQDRAAHVGFDWPVIDEVEKKVMEEWQEVAEAKGSDSLERELGDLLFAVVNLVRWYKVDAETALRKANEMFYRRFRHIETQATMQGRTLTDLSLDEMESLWQEAKKKEVY